MQSWLQWLVYILAGLGALGIISAFIYWIVTLIRKKLKIGYLKYKDFYFKYKNNYLKYEDYYLKHKNNKEAFDKEVTFFFVRLVTGEIYAFEIGYNFEKYCIVNGKLYDNAGCYLGIIEKIIFRGE